MRLIPCVLAIFILSLSAYSQNCSHRVSYSLDVGWGIGGSLGWQPRHNVATGVGYELSPAFSLVSLFDYTRFPIYHGPSDHTTTLSNSTKHVLNLSTGVRAALPTTVSPDITVGLGISWNLGAKGTYLATITGEERSIQERSAVIPSLLLALGLRFKLDQQFQLRFGARINWGLETLVNNPVNINSIVIQAGLSLHNPR